MPHQCTKCGIVFPDASKEILIGCTCGSRFFYYIKQEKYDSIASEREISEKIEHLDKADKIQIEKDIREITGMDEKPETPVILDLESVNVISPGKFEIDIVNLLSKKRPLIYRLEEGKYIIDLSGSYKVNKWEVDRKIRDPALTLRRDSVYEESDGRGLKVSEVDEDSFEEDLGEGEDFKEGDEIEDNSGDVERDKNEYIDLT